MPFEGWERVSGQLLHRLSRRSLLQGGAGSATTSVLAVAGGAEFVRAQYTPQLREITLTASEFDWSLMDDVNVRVWGYNGQVPGPELRVREGDTVRVLLQNDLPVPTTIHWHGINLRPEMDGVAGLSQAPVNPGDSFTYEFTATPGGTRWYHSHTVPNIQVSMGLYGPLIVEPLESTDQWDRDYTLMLAEWDMELSPEVAAGTAPAGKRDQLLRGGELGSDFFLINGKMHGAIAPLRLAKGERVLIRVIHAGAIPHPIHTHGHSFTVIATDGNPVPEVARLTKDTLLIGPAERYDLAIEANNPGVWMVHCHIEHHMANGMMTTLWYDGEEPAGPVAGYPGAMGMDSHHADQTLPNAAPAGDAPHDTLMATPVAHAGNVADIEMLDDRFEPIILEIPSGTTVNWVNKGRNWHSVAAYDGSFESGKIPPGEIFSVQFATPGEFKYICKHHGMQGMIGSITVA